MVSLQTMVRFAVKLSEVWQVLEKTIKTHLMRSSAVIDSTNYFEIGFLLKWVWMSTREN